MVNQARELGFMPCTGRVAQPRALLEEIARTVCLRTVLHGRCPPRTVLGKGIDCSPQGAGLVGELVHHEGQQAARDAHGSPECKAPESLLDGQPRSKLCVFRFLSLSASVAVERINGQSSKPREWGSMAGDDANRNVNLKRHLDGRRTNTMSQRVRC